MTALDIGFIIAEYKRGLGDFEQVYVRRYANVTGTNRPYFDYGPIDARVLGYSTDELVGNVSQGDHKVILFAPDLFTAGYPGALREGDKILISRGGRQCMVNIEDPDGNTRRYANTIIAYEARCRGALA